jgi:hypothetical protein
MSVLWFLVGGGIGYLVGSEKTVRVVKRNPTPKLTKAQHQARVRQLRRAGCKVHIHTLPNGDKVVLTNKGCKAPPIR